VGRDRDAAYDLWRKKLAELTALSQGIAIAETSTVGPTLKESVADYLDEIKAGKKGRTLSAYTLSLGYFTASINKVYVTDVDRSDLLAYSVYLRDTEELAPRTVHNHFSNVVSFLKWTGREKIARKGNRSCLAVQPSVFANRVPGTSRTDVH
jgi:site-specific recombinase XerD